MSIADRRYTLDVSIGIKYGEQHFTIRSTTPLEIVPRVPRSSLPPTIYEGEDFDRGGDAELVVWTGW